ncbi:MAG TPA: protein translocase subunit SecD [Lacipirellulaceae bacterium]|nr:protein translocase subunit SecD [Lacipirellulaceae bacterium]
MLGLTILALFVVPMWIGNYLARAWRMPDHGWKISLVVGTLAASILICTFGQFKFGPDLAGGITLIYELAETPPAANQPAAPAGNQASTGQTAELNKLIGALKRRVDPDGTKEITIRAYGPSAVEIIIPKAGQDDLNYVKEKITKIGQLEFRITADPALQKDRDIIDLAKRVPPNQTDVYRGDTKVAEWVPYDVKAKEFGPVEEQNHFVKRMAGDTPQALVLMDPFNVTGEYLTNAKKGIDDTGGPAVHFSFNAQGARRFEQLTGQNKPNPNTGVTRNLGIILDKTLLSAPVIRSTISSEGMISGGTMTDKEVELTVEVLNAGSLPAKLNKSPVSEDIISPTLGGVTVQKGKDAITVSLIGVVLFMIVYYRFSGVVASVALALNLLMVLALMVLIKAAFTLPGLAGLALTVGMSVDTNVLIYERIREELEHGAAMRMAIRNGFDRAMTAIIDTHLTTIISGIVLFYVGTDQVKGFAVTLVLGLLVNLFTAFFCTRVIFDVAERHGHIKKLKMMHVFRNPNFDFLKFRWIALAASWLLIIVGMIAVYFRGGNLLDIDFTGGSSVAFTLNEPVSLATVRNDLAKTNLGDKNLLVVERGTTNTEYTVDTSEQSVDAVKDVISKEFGNKLRKFSFEYRNLRTVKEPNFEGVEADLYINSGPGYANENGVSHDSLSSQLVAILTQNGHLHISPTLTNPDYRRGSSARYKQWTLRIPSVDETTGKAVLNSLQATMRTTPIFPLASKIGGRVSGDMQIRALEAIGVSLVAMVIYLWLRFSKPAYGIAAGVALIHDVLVAVGMLALSHYIVRAVPSLAMALRIESFQINLTIVAALLTIIGYSVNDTIVTFDRLREIKGKSPNINAKLVNDSVNQTLSRTILTVFTVFIVVVILYVFGGEGLHSFAFTFLVGIVTGTYSSVYIASPVVLWLSGVSAAPAKEVPAQNVRSMQPAR